MKPITLKNLFKTGFCLVALSSFGKIALASQVHHLPNDSFINERLLIIRDKNTTSKEKFTSELAKIGEQLAIQLVRDLPTQDKTVHTFTDRLATHPVPNHTNPVLVAILRAALPLWDGVKKVFPESDSGFIAMSRDEKTLEPKTDYVALPAVKGKAVILIDTMLATGGSILDAIKLIKTYEPEKIILVCAIASREGIRTVEAADVNSTLDIYVAAIDEELGKETHNKGYILPGLGDAGDRSFGLKINNTTR